MKVYYLGPPKTFSEMAARKLASSFDTEAELVAQPNFQAVAQACSREAGAAAGILPYYNFLEGLVQESLDLVYEYELHIQGSCRVLIEFSIGGAGDKLEAGEVYSHPKALPQCSDFLHEHLPEALIRSVSSTSEAARLVQEGRGGLAIATAEALREHGLKVLAEDIGNRRQGRKNFTDFLFVTSSSVPVRVSAEAARTMVVITPYTERVGLLAEILAQFAFYDINVAKVHSRPAVPSVKLDIEPQMFYLEVMCPPDATGLLRCADALKYRFGTETVQLLGWFPTLR